MQMSMFQSLKATIALLYNVSVQIFKSFNWNAQKFDFFTATNGMSACYSAREIMS